MSFEMSVLCHATPLTVWKLLYDPVRFSEWWSGVRRSEPSGHGATFFVGDGDARFPMHIATTRESSRVVIRCMTTEVVFTWVLEPHPQGCRVRVTVDLAADDAEHRQSRHEGLRASLPRLAAAAEHEG